MPDKRTARMLEYLLSAVEEGKYVVIKTADILHTLHLPDNDVTRADIKASVKLFIEEEYISCKYFDDNNVCLTSMPKGRIYGHEAMQARKAARTRNIFAGITFLCALLGAFFGTLLANLI